MAEKNILIVVPDKDVGVLLALALEEEGRAVTIVESLEEAEVLLSSSRYDLIITEAFGQNNIYFFNAAFTYDLRRAAGDTPIFLCSKCPSTHHLRSGYYGLAGVIPRPFMLEDVRAKVNWVLQTA